MLRKCRLLPSCLRMRAIRMLVMGRVIIMPEKTKIKMRRPVVAQEEVRTR